MNLPRKAVFVVDESNQEARALMIKLCENYREGAVIFVSAQEFEALKDAVMVLDLSESRE